MLSRTSNLSRNATDFAMFNSRRRLSKTTGSGVWELGKNISVQSSATLWWQCLPSRLQILPLRTLKGSEVTLISVLDVVVAVLYSGGETKYLGCQIFFVATKHTKWQHFTAFKKSVDKSVVTMVRMKSNPPKSVCSYLIFHIFPGSLWHLKLRCLVYLESTWSLPVCIPASDWNRILTANTRRFRKAIDAMRLGLWDDYRPCKGSAVCKAYKNMVRYD